MQSDSQQNLFEAMNHSTPKETPTGVAHMYCDGASSGNPGNAGIGVVIKISDEDVSTLGMDKSYEIAESIGVTTNNVAEYSALIAGLEKAKSLGLKKLDIFLDSELVVRQVNGIYKVRNKNLIPLFEKVKSLFKYFETLKIRHVRRELNREADALAREGAKS